MALITGDPVQLALLVIEFVLLMVTLLLLLDNRREMRSRDTLIDHVYSAAGVITRQEYFVEVVEAIHGSRKEVDALVTGSRPTSEDSEMVERIIEAIGDTSHHGVKARYLLPLAPDRLLIGARYRAAGAEVRFNPILLVNDARYMVVDGAEVIIGVPGRQGKDEPTRKGYTIPSRNVSAIFKSHFEGSWSAPETRGYAEYLKEVALGAKRSNPGLTAQQIAEGFAVEVADVEAALA